MLAIVICGILGVLGRKYVWGKDDDSIGDYIWAFIIGGIVGTIVWLGLSVMGCMSFFLGGW